MKIQTDCFFFFLIIDPQFYKIESLITFEILENLK